MNAMSGWISGQIVNGSVPPLASDYPTSGVVATWWQIAWDRWGKPAVIVGVGLGLVGEMIDRKVQAHPHQDTFIKPIDSPAIPQIQASGTIVSGYRGAVLSV